MAQHAGTFSSFKSHLQQGWEVGGEKEISSPASLPHVPGMELGLSQKAVSCPPSQQPCKLGSVTCILRLGNQCSKELLPASPGLGSQAQLFPEVRRHDGCSVFCQCLLLGFSPHLANGLVRMCVGDFGPRELVRIWWWRCVIRSLPYVQENHEALLFLRFSWVQ